MPQKIMVTGCFDLLHSGHIAFLQEAAALGQLHVCIGSDATVRQLKGRYPANPQNERKFMLEALACVHEVRINRGAGFLDFKQEMNEIQPDIFFVNQDGHTPAKEILCRKQGVAYRVSQRVPAGELPERSTTALRQRSNMPYRIDLAGGWLDQPWVSKLYPGPVLTVSIEPTIEFNNRSGMATSTRKKAIELWGNALPTGEPEQLAKVLFACDNPPGTIEISGSQDAIGIAMPGLNKSNYAGKYWPKSIDHISDASAYTWLENHLYLVPLGPRREGYRVLENTQITAEGAKALSKAAEACWLAIRDRDLIAFGEAVRQSFEAQIAMFPNMVDPEIAALIQQYRLQASGWKLSGAGGGGYLVLVAEQPIPNALQIVIRRAAAL